MQKIIPYSKEHWLSLRSKNINSTEISALFGVNKYLTKFELWHRLAGNTTDSFIETERTIWGKRVEPVIAKGIHEDYGFKSLRLMDEYMWDEEKRLGSSFDYSFENEDGQGILEIKNVDGLIFRDEWLDGEDGLEAPMHIELQVQQQMMLSGITQAWICALVGGNSLAILKRKADPDIFDMITKETHKFWESIRANRPPEPDFSRDAETISSLYSSVYAGKTLNADGNAQLESLAQEYREAMDAYKAADEKKKEIKSKVLMLIDDCEKVKGNGFSISAGLIGPTVIKEYTREGYRNFRFNFPRGKKGL